MVVGVAIFMVTGHGPTVDGPVTALGEPLLVLGVAGLVLSMALAIFKYRLYDIDRLISRTVTYALVTGILLAVHAGSVLGMRPVVDPLAGGSDLAVAGSTLVVAAAFGPLRRRVQATVDRRFNRRQFDAIRAVAIFGQRLRDEVDLDDVRAELRATVASTGRPASASVLLLQARPRAGAEAP